jgi:hypothetical protein
MPTDDGALFELPAGAVVAPAGPADDPATAAQKLRTKQRRTLAAGGHPLGGMLHADAAPYDDKTAPGLRCGDCTHRLRARFPKCDLGPLTHGPATDCRAWWPACRRHLPVPDPKGSAP